MTQTRYRSPNCLDGSTGRSPQPQQTERRSNGGDIYSLVIAVKFFWIFGDGQQAKGKQGNMASGIMYLILIQVISRGFTFIANQFLLRYLSPSVLGAATQLEIYSISVLYFARESFRLVLQRQSAPDEDGKNEKTDSQEKSKELTQSIVNMAFLPVVLGSILALALGTLQAKVSEGIANEIPYFNEGLRLTGWACLFELLAEPGFTFIQWRSLFKKRAAIESTAAVIRCLASCATAIIGARMGIIVGVLPFAMGQIAFSLTILFGYMATAVRLSWKENISLFPRPLQHTPKAILGRFSNQLMTLAANIYGQSIVKHFLTQGDSMTLAAMTTLEDQGLFALASNYGSLVARIIFQPIEESSRNLLGRLLTNGEGKRQKVPVERVKEAKDYLCTILHLYVTASILILSLGPTLVPQILSALLGARWSSSNLVKILSCYCYYIPVLALNGVLEAFVSSTASHSQLRRQSLWMAVCSVAFIAVAYIFLSVLDSGASGIVWANIANMVLRIIWSFRHIRNYFGQLGVQFQVSDFVPKFWTFALGGASISIMSILKPLSSLKVPFLVQSLGIGGLLAIIM
ncbi:rft domain-containing protein [Ascosphaera apis ARSEF 7405]|uniref:Man(5)GlcNAc(2)-PP-dolichol translocation protein RFT1 n=1 Tax=Ascosphaera apis ARSEF 7405 TaxID=392613 RepID=A0A167XXU1_9EURO|nr:rft domain-containing protein [Ascosphaera apis ARSEF 7405]